MDRDSKDTDMAAPHSRMSSCEPSEPSSPAKTGNSSSMRILIVEDNRDHREILHTLLDSLGYVCQEAANGSEGLNELRRSIFNLVMTDYQMPQMNGIQLIHQVRNTQDLSAIPIILMTGHSDPKVIDHARAVGATSTLLKPYSLEDLKTSLNLAWAMKQKP